MEFDPILDYEESDKEFEPYFRIVQTKVVDSYLWYKKRKKPARINFRVAGGTVILFSVTIPTISAYSFDGKDTVITIMALAIAVFSGFNTFFKWGEKWQGFGRSELAIKHLIGLWQLDVRNAKSLKDENNRSKALNDATNKLLEEVGKIVSQETETYFSNVQWPKKEN